MIHAYVQGNYVKLDNKNAGVRGESNVTALALHFSPEWSDFSKRLLWKDSRGQKVVSVVLTPVINKDTAAGYPMEYHTEIPYEALAYMGWCSFIVEGFLPNDTAKVAKSVTARMYVQENEAEGDTPENTPAPTPSEIQQLQAAVDNAIGVAAADKAAAEQAAESAQLSASAASVNAKAAEDAAADASAAATRAYDYKGLSEQFAALAGAHEANALQASIAAQNAQSAAESAKAGAEKAKTGAETAKSGAEKAKSFAETAKTAAETAKSQANTFAQNAAASATTAENAASAAQDAAVTAQNAKNASEQSAINSLNSARTSATNASTAVSNANEAGRSASAAKASETNAKSSETNAKASETAAAKSAEEAAQAADAVKNGVQSDMAENDPTKPSYVLRRTHWKEVEPMVSLFNRSDVGYEYTQADRIGLEVGETYEVYYDGNTYDTVGVVYAADGETGVTLKTAAGTPPGCTIVDFSPETAAKNGYGLRITKPVSQYSTITITGPRIIWHKMERGYLPDELGNVKTVNDQLPDAYGNVQVDVGVKTVNGQTPDASGNVQVETGGGGGTVQADLAENDPNAAGYVKNRTHWRELELGEVLFDKTLMLTFQESMTISGSVNDGLVAGNTYLVFWEDVEYKCVCGTTTAGKPYVGDRSIIDTDAAAADYPFCIEGLGGASYKVYRKSALTAARKGKVQAVAKDKYHKLDPNYVDFVLKSPGGKKFRVTVSDSGALSAVEVTE